MLSKRRCEIKAGSPRIPLKTLLLSWCLLQTQECSTVSFIREQGIPCSPLFSTFPRAAALQARGAEEKHGRDCFKDSDKSVRCKVEPQAGNFHSNC